MALSKCKKWNPSPATKLYIHRTALLFCTLVLLTISSIGAPAMSGLIMAKTTFKDTSNLPTYTPNYLPQTPVLIKEVDLGAWGFCIVDTQNKTSCHNEIGYSFALTSSSGSHATIPTEWVNALGLTPIAAAINFVAFIVNIPTRRGSTYLGLVTATLAVLMTFVAFIYDIVFFALVKKELGKLAGGPSTDTGGGLWLTFDAVIELLVLAPFLLLSARAAAMRKANPQPVVVEDLQMTTSRTTSEADFEKGLVMESEKPVWQHFRK
ncbi:hypothetical protein SISSUDRAFT_579966 [Sistotremastrum suecicum HHB10207 ss-3]|uniref:Pali-domain-containing protein n=1 Tax=Sistotremastrum suecicum HHB10207 ss-3 TaxID=1314776 RepID=A0A166ENL6_9AGAM|nr:hypothetical protein SISSUDRAFT_579966 [Sistotremastrum suecicum HHB10207 ss-3]